MTVHAREQKLYRKNKFHYGYKLKANGNRLIVGIGSTYNYRSQLNYYINDDHAVI